LSRKGRTLRDQKGGKEASRRGKTHELERGLPSASQRNHRDAGPRAHILKAAQKGIDVYDHDPRLIRKRGISTMQKRGSKKAVRRKGGPE